MSNILTPITLWKKFNDRLEVMPVTLGDRVDDGIKFEYLNFSGRDTGMGRVTVYGVLATKEANPAHECVLILRDSSDDIDEGLLAYFVKCGYSALCVDYGGERDGVERYTQYPSNVRYANVEKCGRYKDYVDFSAEQTCWYEWVAVGIYARKFLAERFSTQNIGLVGIRDGGEVAWKLAYAARFSCAVTISACGWKAYKGLEKFKGQEPEFDEERYRFVAGIDSQAYAPYIKCPMLMLCTTNDPAFDYDRAFDTFCRINPDFARSSSIAYSINCGSRIDVRSTNDMFMFLDGYVKNRHVFMPKPAEVSVFADEEGNLVARVSSDSLGIVEKCGVYFAEDCYDYATRAWSAARYKRTINSHESEYFLDVYEKSKVLFVMCFTEYSNGFTVWSKLSVKKISGNFRNSMAKSNIIFTNKFGTECFSIADSSGHAVGGVLLTDNDALPEIITEDGLKGVYSKCGLMTNRINNYQYAPRNDSILSLDVCSEEDITLDVSLKNKEDGTVYSVKLYILGGVWQSQTLKAKVFKNQNGVSLTSFVICESLSIIGSGRFALNNLIWL
ncbi:MAG: hypothetical protein K2O44_02560 [Clostridia bacterium]|nr:hypothetical protein [Clostridia bacterium]